jgi:hypothetical protein
MVFLVLELNKCFLLSCQPSSSSVLVYHWPKNPNSLKIEERPNIRGGIVRGAQIAFAEKHRLLTQAHELTKSRRKSWQLSSIFF